MVGRFGAHRQAYCRAEGRSHLQPGSINGADLVANSALFSPGIDVRIPEVRTHGRVYLAHDHPASSLGAGSGAAADPFRGGRRPGRSTSP